MNNAPSIENPVMLDAIIADIQKGLVENIDWLDVAFGRAQRLTKMIQGKKVITPNVFCGGWNHHGPNDYIEVSPDSKIGNFSFFEIDELGLDWMDVKILDALARTFRGRPVGLTTIASAVGEDPSTLEDVYEPYLLQQGLIIRTPQGRQATSAAFEHLGIVPPTQ